MKSLKRLLFACALIATFQVSLEAQILDRLSRSIDQAIDKEVNKITEKMVERIIERILTGEPTSTDSLTQYQSQETSDSSSTSSSTGFNLSSIFGGSSSKVEKSFTFDYKMKVNIQNGKESNNFDVFVPEEGAYSGMSVEDMFVIVDYETGDTYTIINGSLIQMNMTKFIEKMNHQIDVETDDSNPPTIKKTGKSEMIAGYKCYEYVIDSDDSNIDVWITEDFLTNGKRSSAIIKLLNLENKNTEINSRANALKIITRDKKNKNDVTTMIVESIKKEQKSVDLSQYCL